MVTRKIESLDTDLLLSHLKQEGYFRNITDLYQIGIPDIVGCRFGFFYGLEVKSVKSIPEDGICPRKSEHRFTKKQVEELKGIDKSGGLGVGIIICGKTLFFGLVSDINDEGQMNCHKLQERGNVAKMKNKRWDLSNFFLTLEKEALSGAKRKGKNQVRK
jgi:hypothetical protein